MSWHPTNRLSITNTVVGGPLTINSRSVIESDAMYNGFPAVVQAANGDFVLSYKKGPSHVNSPLVMLRRSQDGGATWSPEVVYFDSSKPDPALTRTPLGALLIAFVKLDQNGCEAGAYRRSADNGLTWGPFTFFDNPPTNTFVVDPLVNAGQTMYVAGYGPYRGGAGYTPTVWSSSDDGFTWTKLSELREPGDPGLNETATLEFRFSSKPTPAGSQFSVVLQGQASGSASSLINWELPSSHSADPTADSVVISNGQFVPVLNSFIYGQPYRLRTVVDETQGTQQVSVLDKFGAWI